MSDNPELPSPPVEVSAPPVSIAPAPPVALSFGKTDWLAFWLCTAVVLGVYLFTIVPDVSLGFSGLFAVGTMYQGVPDPPGFPVFTLYSWPFTVLLPWSTIAWRVAVASAVAGALACGLVALLVSTTGGSLLEHLPSPSHLNLKEQQALRIVCGLVAGLGIAFDQPFWRNAISGVPWSLAVLLLVLMLALLMKWFYSPHRRHFLYGASLIFGLMLCTSQVLATAVFGVPLLLVLAERKLGRDVLFLTAAVTVTALVLNFRGSSPFYELVGVRYGPMWLVFLLVALTALGACVALLIETRRFFSEWKAVFICAASLLAGLSFYLYLPLVSMTNPPINWAYPRTVEGFVHLVTRGQFEYPSPTGSFGRLAMQIRLYATTSTSDFGLFYFLSAALPFLFLRKMRARERRWLLSLLGFFLGLSLVMLILLNPGDRLLITAFPFYTASHLLLALLAGLGLLLLGRSVALRSR